MSSENESIKEKRELEKLMNLNSLLKKAHNKKDYDEDNAEESDTSAIEEVPKKPRKTKSKAKEKEKPDTLLNYMNSGSESFGRNSAESDSDLSGMEDNLEVKFFKLNRQMVKDIVLESSSEESTECSIDEDLENNTTEEEEDLSEKSKDKQSNKENNSKHRPQWMNDKLLRVGNFSASSSEEDSKSERNRKKKLRHSPPKMSISSTEDSSSEKYSNKKKKSKCSEEDKPKNNEKRIEGDISSSTSSDCEMEVICTPKSQDTPTKGRKNIKKIIRKQSLQLETKQALKLETERKKRLAERQKIYDELYPHVEGEEYKRLVLDFDPIKKVPLVEVHRKLVKKLKPHQIQGVKFMWNNCFESMMRKGIEDGGGSGCILAHCMGLGKTLQVVTLVHTILSYKTGVRTVLVVCPLNTVSNWISEFQMWLKGISDKVKVYSITQFKSNKQRSQRLNTWHTNGGVMILSYDMFRIFTKDTDSEKTKKYRHIFHETLLDPGPELIVCDEGHLLKNETTALSKCIRKVGTSKRIVLTGTPLQNNLTEYHCMVQFIKPNILGSRKEFMNRFFNPINNGQFEDSTDLDVKIMKKRSHVLHTMLDGCIQRFDYSVLTPFLPEKHEYVILISLTETQAKVYKHYLAKITSKKDSTSLLKDFHVLQRVFTHPLAMLAHLEKQCGKNEDADSPDESTTLLNQTDLAELRKKGHRAWWDDLINEEEMQDLRSSGKLVFLFCLLKECRTVDEKVLVFSQSLYTLNLIEHFLDKINRVSQSDSSDKLAQYADRWLLGSDYFRLDGSTSSENRTRWCNIFNDIQNRRARLFLISTRAGGLGINLVAANRVVIFDASWNPSHDVQSIFRVYRFGQKKICYIYRFLAEATLEEKIYERQVTKLSLSHRVVDEHQIERHYSMGTLQELYRYEPTAKENRKVPQLPKDRIFAEILNRHKDLIVGYHEHDSLLENKQEEELTEEERLAAWEEFEKEPQVAPELLVPNPPHLLAPDFNNVKNDVLRMMQLYKNPRSFPTHSNDTNKLSPIPVTSLENWDPKKQYHEALLDSGLALGLRPYEGENLGNFFDRVCVRQHQLELRKPAN